MLRPLLFAAALALAACGPSATTSTSTATSTTASAPAAAALTPEQITTAVAALPAPYNSGDYAAGRRQFGLCASCHTINAANANRTGPHLHRVVGRQVASAEGFVYSDAMKSQSFAWDAARLDAYLADPRGNIPGNRMAFAGVRDETQRRNLITYLLVESAR